jgi:hypothetical protein
MSDKSCRVEISYGKLWYRVGYVRRDTNWSLKSVKHEARSSEARRTINIKHPSGIVVATWTDYEAA